MRQSLNGLLAALVLAFTAFVSSAPAAGVQLTREWSRQMGTALNDYAQGIAVDSACNIYLAGGLNMDVDRRYNGSGAMFLAKYDDSGNRLWLRTLDQPNSLDWATGVSVDGSGNAYMTGITYGSFTPGSPAGSASIIVKYDAGGSMKWLTQVSSVLGSTSLNGVCADLAGNVYCAGFAGDTGLGGPGYGIEDAIVVKCDTQGHQVWATRIGSAADDYAAGIAVDGRGCSYISGWTRGNVGGPSYGPPDAFAAKLGANGELVWKKQFGTANSDVADAIAVDEAGDAFVVGHTQGAMQGTNKGGSDVFVSKFDTAGNAVWTKQLGSAWNDVPYGVIIDRLGRVFVSGTTGGLLGDSQVGQDDLFLAELDALGNLLGVIQPGSTLAESYGVVAEDPLYRIYLAGGTGGSMGGTNQGNQDVILMQFSPEPATLSLLALGGVALLRRRARDRA